MAVSFVTLSLQAIFLEMLIVSAQPINRKADTDFWCSPNSTETCDTFVTYRALFPGYLDLGSISDLFGISRLDISNANQFASENAQLVPDQLLLIPIKCSCNGSYFFSNVTYQIKAGDSFYAVSIHAFQNLTRYQFAEDMNPSWNSLNLSVGAALVFPLLCKCPDKSNNVNEKGAFSYLLTYVWQPGDNVSSVGSMFNTSPAAIAAENNNRNFSAAICLPVLVPVQHPHIVQSFIRPALPRQFKHRKPNLVAVLSISLSLLLVLMALLLYVRYFWKKNDSLPCNSCSIETLLIGKKKVSRAEICESKLNQDKVIPGVSGYLGKLIVYDKEGILEATSDLNERYHIGGSVYRAKIQDQMFVVKKTKDGTDELKLLQKVSHGNLMKLVGICLERQRAIFLVFEYAENGSLDKWLFHDSSPSSSSSAVLSWSQRLNIASDIANGLQYMHELTQPSIVHRDIRTGNILLDSKFKAKISNFSLAKPAMSSSVLKVDVFAFGVVLLELLSGRKSMEIKENGEIVMLWKEINGVLGVEEKKDERLRNWMDPLLRSFYPIDGALSLASLAKACTSEKASKRPKMVEVVFNLCLLNQSTSDMYEKSWNSAEPDEAIQFVNQVVAR